MCKGVEFAGLNDNNYDWLSSKEVSTGTTLVAIEFDGGVVVGADSRTSMGTWISNRITDKLTPVTDSIMACRSGSAADTQVNIYYILFKISFIWFVFRP